jgi:hypothetical protein
MRYLILIFTSISVFASNSPIRPLVSIKDFPSPDSQFKEAAFKKIQNGRIERNLDIYGADSWVKDVSPCEASPSCKNKVKSIHIECALIPPGYFCETSTLKNPGKNKVGIPYLYERGKNQYLIVAGNGREDGEEQISVLTQDFKELCGRHFTGSYRNISGFLKNPDSYLKWNDSSCEFYGKSKERKTDVSSG